MNTPLETSKISFQYRPANVLRHGGELLSVDDDRITPDVLQDFVASSTNTLSNRLTRLDELNAQRHPDASSHPVTRIMLARLAVNGRENIALTREAIDFNLKTYSRPENFTPLSRSYVDALSHTAFTVEIVQRSARSHLDTKGVWISLRK